MQICVSEESLGVKFLPFLMIILGVQVRQVYDAGIWFSIRFQSYSFKKAICFSQKLFYIHVSKIIIEASI